MPAEKFDFRNKEGNQLAALLDRPDGPVRAVALFAHYLAFFMQMRPALYVALIALSPVTLLLDRLLPAKKFEWLPAPQKALQGATR